jgi:hypothetical protein
MVYFLNYYDIHAKSPDHKLILSQTNSEEYRAIIKKAKDIYQTQDPRAIEQRLKTFDERDNKKDGIIDIQNLELLLIEGNYPPAA